MSSFKLINDLNHKYHTLGQPDVNDGFYDVMKEQYEKETGESLGVGSQPTTKKILLPVYLGSLDKINRDNSALDNFQKKYKGDYVISDKVDGISALLYYDGLNVSLMSRGNGKYGQNISHILPYISNIPTKFKKPNNNTEMFAIRGELVLYKSDEEKDSRRNIVTGLVITAKKPDNTLLSKLKMIPYTVYIPKKMSSSQQIDWLRKQGWDPVWMQKKQSLDFRDLSNILVKRKDQALYDIDGIVVSHDGKYDIPDDKISHAFAFKNIVTDETAEVIVSNVVWNVSKNGLLKPTVEFHDPPTIGGAQIRKATGHNAEYILKNGLGTGAVVEVTRSGGVIPYIKRIIEKAPEIGMNHMPTNVIWKGKELSLNESDYDVKLPTLESFFQTIKIRGLSTAGIQALYNAGYQTPLDVLNNVSKETMEKVIGKANGEKIYKEMQSKKHNLDFFTFVVAHNIITGGFGIKKLELLKNKYPYIFDYKSKNNIVVQDLQNIDGFSKASAEKLKQGLDNLEKFKQNNKKDLDKLFG